MMLLLQLFNGKLKGTRDRAGLNLKFKGIPEIQNQKVFTGIKPLLHFFRGDSCDG